VKSLVARTALCFLIFTIAATLPVGSDFSASAISPFSASDCIPNEQCLEAGQPCPPKKALSATRLLRRVPGTPDNVQHSLGIVQCRRVGKTKQYRWRLVNGAQTVTITYDGTIRIPADDYFYGDPEETPSAFKDFRCTFTKGIPKISYYSPSRNAIVSALSVNCEYTILNQSDVYDMPYIPREVSFQVFWRDSYNSAESIGYYESLGLPGGGAYLTLLSESCLSTQESASKSNAKTRRTIRFDCANIRLSGGRWLLQDEPVEYWGARSAVESKFAQLTNQNWAQLAAGLPVLVTVGGSSGPCFWLGRDSNTLTMNNFVLANATERAYGAEDTLVSTIGNSVCELR
jgi:hypothetical protein